MKSPHNILARIEVLRIQLTTALDADLAGIRILFVPDLPIAAIAYGDTVVVAEQILQEDQTTLLGVIVHELVHVFQQRAGRVEATDTVAGLPFCRTDHLEAEAEEGVQTVLNGKRLRLRAPRQPRANPPVVQPLVSVGGSIRSKLSEFSESFQQVLPLIPQGPQWLQWALRIGGPVYPTDSEADLLNVIQSGLHGSVVALFQSAGLRIAPSVLPSLPDADRSNLVTSLQLGQLTPAAQAVLTKNHFRSEADFGKLASTLTSLGVANQLAANPSSLAEQIGLYDVFVARTNPNVSVDDAGAAARFAASVAQSAPDFGAAYAFFITATTSPSGVAGVPSLKPEQVPTLWTELNALAFDFLKCPLVPSGATDWLVLQALESFIRKSPCVGFSTLGTAIAGCAASGAIALTLPLQTDAREQLGEFLLRIARFLQSVLSGDDTKKKNPEIQPCQDGITRWYRFSDDSGNIRLMLDAQGCLTLSDFTPKAASSTP